MGDLIGEIVGGTLYSVPREELARIANSNLAPNEKVGLLAAASRINALFMIAKAGSGHIGSSFSSMEIMSYLYANEVYPKSTAPSNGEAAKPEAIFFSSKGHDAPALYSVLISLGILDHNLLGRLRRLGGLPGHPDVGTPGIVTNTGSLGMGVSKAKGFIKANRLRDITMPVYVLTGDGELQEGQFWESLGSAVNHKMDELTVIVDHNKLQSDTLVSRVSDLGDLEKKLAAFGWHVERCDGNDVSAFATCLANCKSIKGRPQVIIADTVKGKGVSFMEHTSIDSDVENYKFHSGAPSAENYKQAVFELFEGVNRLLQGYGLEALSLETEEAQSVPHPSGRMQRLIPAYSEAIIKLAEQVDDVVALDADLILDTGLIPFSERFPEQFIECGIAEQDMVSQAGALALAGMLPIVHSFACFLAARPREQIYNNASEHTKIIYVGSLAGILPGGPGHSHQGVSDIATIGHIPGMIVLVPGFAEEVEPLLSWAVHDNAQSSYIRLESIPVELDLEFPTSAIYELGKGISLNKPVENKLITYGPTMISIALQVAEELMSEHGIVLEVINHPWVNHVDQNWLTQVTASSKLIICLENHLAIGGLGDRLSSSITRQKSTSVEFVHAALDSIPVGGNTNDVLSHHSLDVESIKRQILEAI